MKKYTFSLLLALSVFGLPLSAQDWVSMMRDPHANVHAVQQAFNQWYSRNSKGDKDKLKPQNPNGKESDKDECYELFKRWEWFNVPRATPSGNRADFNLVGREYQSYLQQHPIQNQQHHGSHRFQAGGTWTYVGNTQVPTNSNTGFGGDGRVNRVRFMPGNSNIIFACAASGGLWKSTNGGGTWSTNTDQLGDLTTSDVAINPNNTNVMYLATGDGDGIQSIYPDPATIGVLKSTDGGNTWNATSLSYTLSNAGANYYSVNELIIDPTDTAVVLAATTMGIYRTTNSGSTWTLATGTGSGNAKWFHSIAFHPGNANVVYASTSNVINGIGGNFYRSVNNGASWTNITAGLPSNANAEGMTLAVTAADSSIVYVLADRVNFYDFEGLYVSTNDGVSFTQKSGNPTPPNILGNNDAFGPGFGYGQGWYDLTMAVSPTNKDSILVGGIDIYLSTDGGVTWNQSSDWLANGHPFVHADVHHIEPIPGNSLGFATGCDGGVFLTTNGGPNWTDVSNNLEIAEQYSIGPSATVAGRWITGWQDNGTNLSSSPWSQVLGGDGMVCFIDWSVPGATTFFAENPNGAFEKTTNSGSTWNGITTGISEGGPWVTQWCQDPKTAANLYGGFKNVWKSTNQGGSWSKISTWGSNSITALAVDSAVPNYIYAAQSNMMQFTSNGGTSWTNITGTLPVGSANITGIAVSSKSPSHVWVTFSGYSSGNKVFYSSNFGTSWTNISTGLPNLPVNCIVSQSNSPNGVYIGTDQGVYYNDTVLNNWMFYNSGLPMVMIGNLAIYEPGQILLAATYGRGTWETPLYVNSPCPPPTVTISNTSVKCHGTSTGTASCTATGGTPPYTYLWAPSGGTNSTATGLAAGTYTITVTTAGGCIGTASTTITQPATALSVTTGGITNVKCNGATTGSASCTAAGGTPAYAYNWTPSGGTNATATGLTAGTYTVTVTDANSCTATAIATITQPATALSASASALPTACASNTGTASVTATGGTPAYAYSWAPSGGTNATATGLSAGTYTVTVTDANSCTATAMATVTSIGGPTVTLSNTSVKCFGASTGTASSTVSGGTSPYAYNWTPSGGTNATATGLSAGTYTLTVVDFNGCIGTASTTITQPASALSASASATATACSGSTGTASVTATGGTPGYVYNWAPSGGTNATATGLSAGTYTVTVTDANSCTATAMATVTTIGGPTVTLSNTSVKCFGASTGTASSTVSGGTSPYAYNWTPSGGTNATATGLSAGTYTLTVVDLNGCIGTASTTITQPASALSASTGSIVNVKCFGGATGSATVTTAGGTPAYAYNWAPSGGTNATATGLIAGTYTVTVTDANSCTATAIATITQPGTLSVATIGIFNVQCNGGSTGSATATVTGGTPGYGYSWAPSGGTNATATGLSAGTYTVTVTDANSCTATAIATITQPATALSASASATGTACASNTGTASVTATGGTPAYAYSWAPSGGTNATATGLSAGTYTVTVTDANSCTATAMATVTSIGGPTVTLSNTSVKCFGASTGTASSTVSGGTSPYAYNWTPSGGTNATATGLSAGTYTLTVVDLNGCIGTASTTITQPATALSASTGSIVNVKCFGGATGSATVTAAGGTPAYAYNWAPSGGTNATATGLTAGTYTVTVTDANSCTATAIATITQPASALSASTGSIVNVKCNGGSTGSATVTATGGTPAYIYNWAPSGGTNATATGLTAGTYTVTVTDANSCTATAMATITQPTKLNASAGSIVNVKCNGGSTGSATVTATGGTPVYAYNWAPSGGTNATATGLAAGTYTVTVTDANSCTATAIATITQPPILSASTGSIVNVKCHGGSTGSATVTAIGGTPAYVYNWAPSGGTNATATGLSAGTYTVTVTDAHACTTTATTTITQPPVLTAGISIFTNITCNGGSNGSATVTATGGSGAYTYNWTPLGGTNANATGLTAGTYTATITDANGCTATASVTLTQPPAMTVTPSAPVICSGDSVILTASGASTYTWSPAYGLSATVGPVVTAGPSVTTLYIVTGTTGGCVNTDSVLVTVNPTPTLTLVPASAKLCSGDSVVIRAFGATSYSWAPSGGLSNNVGLVVTAFPATTTTYTVTGITNGCSATKTITITVTPTPTVTVNPAIPAPICSGDSVALTASGASGYLWSPATGLSSNIGATVKAAPGITTSYTVTGTTGSCSGYAIVVVSVNPTPTVTVTPSSATMCSDSSGVAITASGATSYSWSPAAGLSNITGPSVTASPSVTTTYTVIGTSGGCSATQTVTITVNPTPTIVVTPSLATICKGDSVSLTASGAGSYTWSPGTGLSGIIGANVKASPATSASYTVTGVSGSCSGTAVVMVNVNPKPSVIVIPPSATICAGGGGVTLDASGAATYVWSPPAGLSSPNGPVVTADPGTTTTYTVTGTTEGCSDSAVVTVTVDSAVIASITGKDTICGGDSTILTASGGGSYSWSTGATSNSITVKPAISTQYSVTVTKGACSNTAVSLIVVKDCTTGINALSFADNIIIFPNPTSGSVQVLCSIPDGDYVFRVTDVLGQVLIKENRHVAGNNSYLLNLSAYSSGMYVLTITGSNSVTQKKIILTK